MLITGLIYSLCANLEGCVSFPETLEMPSCHLQGMENELGHLAEVTTHTVLFGYMNVDGAVSQDVVVSTLSGELHPSWGLEWV